MSVSDDGQVYEAAAGGDPSGGESSVADGGSSEGGSSTGGVGAAAERPSWLETAPIVAELDAGSFLATGEDPFFAIQDAARTVAVGEALRLRAPFAPVPLYGVLARKGFAVHSHEVAPEQWEITFYRERAVSADVDADDTHPHGATRA